MGRLITLLLAVAFSHVAFSQSVMSPMMRSCVKAAGHGQQLEAFVTASDDAIATLERSGMKVDARMGNLAIITGSVEAFSQVVKVKGVSRVDKPGKVYLHCDSARSFTHTNELLQGRGFEMPYRGAGVVVGMIDCGIDYQHMAFKDKNGKSRITRIYHPADLTGSGVVVDGTTLQGREYVTPIEIASIATDDRTMGHGTHTTGIAAGTTVGKYGGMAPDAELVMVGIPNNALDITNVVRGIRYIATYAASVGKRCVINMSLGSHDGPHDGTGYLQQYMEELNKRYGTIFVLSSGNEGDIDLYLHKKFTDTDKTLSTVMMTNKNNDSEIYAYSRDESKLGISLSLIRTDNVTVTPLTDVLTTDTVIDMTQLVGASAQVSGQVSITQGETNGKYHIILKNDFSLGNNGQYLAFSIHGEAGGEVDVWDANTDACFSSCSLPGYSDGSSEGSYSDMATGDYCISVGAISARPSYPVGTKTTPTNYAMGNMARFSSYGTDITGAVHPFIVAPGVSVVSSVSRLNCSKTNYSQCIYDDNNVANYWYVKSGTSMSAPCVSGIIALWLQACPHATLNQIKEAMAQTAIKYADGNPLRGANGLIDAQAGLHYLIEHYSSTHGDVNADGVVDVDDVNILINIILGNDDVAHYGTRAYVNGDDVVDVDDVNAVINIILLK